MLKRIFCLILAAATLFVLSVSPVSAFTPKGFEVKAERAVLLSFDTGEYIYEKNADSKGPVGALNMLMSALVIAENCSDLDAGAALMTLDVKKSLLGTGLGVASLKIGEKYSVRELLSLAIVGSYSDALVLAANHVFGSVSSCVDAMNRKAAELSMADSFFSDVMGYDSTQYSTARDVAKLFKAAYANSVVGTLIATKSYTLTKTDYRPVATENYTDRLSFSNTCMIINPATVHFYNRIKAGKTGYTDASGRCIASIAEHEGNRYICVLLGEPATAEKDENGNTVRHDFRDTRALVDWVFRDFTYKCVVSKGDIITDVAVDMSGEQDRLTVSAGQDLYATLPTSSDGSTVRFDYDEFRKQTFKAPISAGDELGKVDVYYGEHKIGEISLIATTDVQSSFGKALSAAFSRVIRSGWFTGLCIAVAAVILGYIVTVVIMNTVKKAKRSKKVHKH